MTAASLRPAAVLTHRTTAARQCHLTHRLTFYQAKRRITQLIRYGSLPSAGDQFGADVVTETEGKLLTTRPCEGSSPWNAQITTFQPSQQATEQLAATERAERTWW